MDMAPDDMGDLSHPVPLGVEGLEWQVLVFESMLDKMDTEYLREDSHERVLAVFPLTGEETKQTTEHLTHPYRRWVPGLAMLFNARDSTRETKEVSVQVKGEMGTDEKGGMRVKGRGGERERGEEKEVKRRDVNKSGVYLYETVAVRVIQCTVLK